MCACAWLCACIYSDRHLITHGSITSNYPCACLSPELSTADTFTSSSCKYIYRNLSFSENTERQERAHTCNQVTHHVAARPWVDGVVCEAHAYCQSQQMCAWFRVMRGVWRVCECMHGCLFDTCEGQRQVAATSPRGWQVWQKCL